MIKKSKSYKIFEIFNTVVLIVIVFITLYPILYVLAQSLSSQEFVYAGEITFYPKGFTIQTYKEVIKEVAFWTSYKNTIIYTVTGTFISVFATAIFGYALSKKRLKGRTVFIVIALFTMFFHGGLIPNYMIVKGLGLRNSMFAIIIPPAINTWNLLIMKTFFEAMPEELEEAASIDGYDTFRIFFRIVIPLSKPIMFTMVLFYAVGIWNNWFHPMLYLDEAKSFPMALYLRNIISGTQVTNINSMQGQEETLMQIRATIKSATIVLSVIPILCVYPFIQKYFIQGVMIGSIKG